MGPAKNRVEKNLKNIKKKGRRRVKKILLKRGLAIFEST